MPNGNAFKPEYELILIGKDLSKEPKEDLRVLKKRKLKALYPFGAGIVSGDGSECVYRISKTGVQALEGDKLSQEKFKPWGVSDIESAINSGRIDADENLTPGEMYLIGDAIGVLQATTQIRGVLKLKPKQPDSRSSKASGGTMTSTNRMKQSRDTTPI